MTAQAAHSFRREPAAHFHKVEQGFGVFATFGGIHGGNSGIEFVEVGFLLFKGRNEVGHLVGIQARPLEKLV